MLDHISLGVANLEQSKKFYDQVLSSLGLKCLYSDAYSVGYGLEKAFFWICIPLDEERGCSSASNGSHFAFAAKDQEVVKEFFKRAVAAGGKSDGAPDFKKDYGKNYFAAYIFDLDGHKIEAVNRGM